MRVARAAAALLLCAIAGDAIAGGERFVLAWPPTRYDSAELVLWRDEAGADPLRVRVTARGLDRIVDVPPVEAVRIPLPPEARCADGLDGCAIEAARVEGAATFSALLQSPDTNGAADTLLLTAHDTIRLPPASEAGRAWTALSLPCADPSETPFTSSFVTIVAAQGPARVSAPASCAGAIDAVVAPGEALTITCSAQGDDLSGLAIVADAPVVAVSGNAVTTVPVDPGRGLSGDLAMDLAAEAAGAARYAVPPLPRSAALAGRGDVVRIVALEPATVTIRDDRGGARSVWLARGEVHDADTAAAGSDLALSLESDAGIAAWHVPKSRLLRGLGDPAAIPLVPSSRFTLRDRVFVPDGYGEANVLVVAAEPGAAVRLDGQRLVLQPAPGGLLDMAVVDLGIPPSGGSVHDLDSDLPFGAWVAGFGGYKAYGHVAASAAPQPLPWLHRGATADALEPLAQPAGRRFEDADAAPRLYWRVEDASALLRVTRCGASCCLSW